MLNTHAGGASEQITGQALKNLKLPRENVIVASKVFGEVGPGPNARGASRAHIHDAIKASLKRLQLDHKSNARWCRCCAAKAWA